MKYQGGLCSLGGFKKIRLFEDDLIAVGVYPPKP
jgi:hypothetical protein